MLYLDLDRDCSGNRLLLVLSPLFWVLVQLSVMIIRPSVTPRKLIKLNRSLSLFLVVELDPSLKP